MQVQVQSDQRQPQGRLYVGSHLFRGSKEAPGSCRDGSPGDPVPVLYCTHMMRNSEGEAYGALPATSPGKRLFSIWERLLCFLIIVPHPLTTHSIAIACLKHCSLPLSPLPFQNHRKKDADTTEAVFCTLGPFLQMGDEICLEDLQNSVPALFTVGGECERRLILRAAFKSEYLSQKEQTHTIKQQPN